MGDLPPYTPNPYSGVVDSELRRGRTLNQAAGNARTTCREALACPPPCPGTAHLQWAEHLAASLGHWPQLLTFEGGEIQLLIRGLGAINNQLRGPGGGG